MFSHTAAYVHSPCQTLEKGSMRMGSKIPSQNVTGSGLGLNPQTKALPSDSYYGVLVRDHNVVRV